MSGFGDAIERGLTGRAGPPPVGGLADQLRLVQEAYGSGAAAARALGVSESTFRRWKVAAGLSETRYTRRGGRSPGTKPAGTNASRLQASAEQAARQRAIVFQPTDQGIRLDAKHTHGADRNRPRRGVTGRDMRLRNGTADRVKDAYVKGGKEAAARAFLAGITDDWWHDALAYDGPEPPDDDYGLAVTAVYF